jgi:hypothetical protein
MEKVGLSQFFGLENSFKLKLFGGALQVRYIYIVEVGRRFSIFPPSRKENLTTQ